MIIKPLSHQAFVADFEDFCSTHKIALSELGFRALKDRAFYLKLKRGHSPTLQRIERVYDFMIDFERARGLEDPHVPE